MYLTTRAALIGGIALIALAVCLVVFIAGRADIGGNSPSEKTESLNISRISMTTGTVLGSHLRSASP